MAHIVSNFASVTRYFDQSLIRFDIQMDWSLQIYRLTFACFRIPIFVFVSLKVNRVYKTLSGYLYSFILPSRYFVLYNT